MTHQEFYNRTGVQVSEKEYSAIEAVYMASDFDKDQFCKMWCKMNTTRVRAAKVERMEKARTEAYKDALWKMVEKFDNLAARIGLCKAWDILTANNITSYEVRALSWFGIEVSTRMFDTVFDARNFLIEEA